MSGAGPRALPVGITGFSHVDAPPLPAPTPSPEDAARHVARAIGAPLSWRETAPIASYHACDLALSPERTALAVHRALPIAATFTQSPNDLRLTFVDAPPPLGRALAEIGWALWPKSWLDAPLAEDRVSALPKWERDQIAYWRPATVGDAAFNLWD